MTVAAITFDGFNIDRIAGAAYSQWAALCCLSTVGKVTAAAATTSHVVGHAFEAATADGDIRSVRYAGTALAIAQTTITPGTHQRVGPTTTAGKIANVTSGVYSGIPILEEAVAANDLFPVILTLGSF